MDVTGKTVVITGGASGIGAAAARAFSAKGARVAVLDLNLENARSVASEFDGLSLECDVSSESDITASVAEIETALGPVDIFFHNAGLGFGGDILSTSLDDWKTHMDVNLMAHIYAIRAVLPGMLKRGSGYHIHNASMAGILTNPGRPAYAVSKHAVVGLAEWMSMTYHDRGIRTSLLAPMGVRTPLLSQEEIERMGDAYGQLKEPEEVAEKILDGVQTERFLILTDDLAEKWMSGKYADIERWISAMRKMQASQDQS